jgi:hypothetical protein
LQRLVSDLLEVSIRLWPLLCSLLLGQGVAGPGEDNADSTVTITDTSRRVISHPSLGT